MVSSPMGTWTQVVVENDLQPGSDGSSVMVTLGTGGGGGGGGGGGASAPKKPKIAPMMAKSLKLAKSLRR